MINVVGTYKPNYLSPAYNPIIWSCNSNNSSEAGMKYVFDIYVDGVYSYRIKQRPNPNGYGMIDLSSIMQAELDYSQETAEITNGETTIDYVNGEVFAENPYLSRHVMIKVGEEVLVDGSLVTYDGVGNNVLGVPAYELYSGNTTDTSLPLHVWSASLPDHEQQWHMQKVTASGVFGGNPYQRDSSGITKKYDHGVALAYPLAFDQLNRGLIYQFDKMVLSFINWSPYPTLQNKVIYGFRYIIRNSNNTPVHIEDVPMITANGYSQRALATTVIGALTDPKFDIVHVLAGPDDIIEALGLGVDHPLSAGMRIDITGHAQSASGSATFGSAVTQTVYYTIKEYCSNPLYPRVRLSWLNTLGGRDYMNFTALMEKTTDVKSESFHQEQMNLDGATPVEILDDGYPINKLGMTGGAKPYNKQAMRSYAIESDWLTQDQVDLLEGLIKSPQVLAYIHDEDNDLSDVYPYVANITNKSYITKNVRQTKLVQGKFTLELAMPQKIQVTY